MDTTIPTNNNEVTFRSNIIEEVRGLIHLTERLIILCVFGLPEITEKSDYETFIDVCSVPMEQRRINHQSKVVYTKRSGSNSSVSPGPLIVKRCSSDIRYTLSTNSHTFKDKLHPH